MIVALDYDDTWTRDPLAWRAALSVLKAHGHTIIGVTMRGTGEQAGMDSNYFDLCDRVYFTSRKGKREYLAKRDIFPSVWIDDTPEFITMNARA